MTSGIWIKSAQRVGVPAFRAARVEKKIMKIPKNEIVRHPRPVGGHCRQRLDLEKDLAINQQGEKLNARKTVLPTELFDVLRRRQHGQGGRNLRIADFEQRAGARRFQHHLVAAPSHVGEPRQDKSVALPSCGVCGQ